MKENLVSLAKLLVTDNVFSLDFFSSTVEEKYALSKKRIPDLSKEDFSKFLQKLQEVQERELSPEELEQIAGGGFFSVIGGLLLSTLQLVGFGGNGIQQTPHEQPESAIVHQLTSDGLQNVAEENNLLVNEIYQATTEENDGSLVGNLGETATEENTVSSAKSSSKEYSTEELYNQQTLPASEDSNKAIDGSSTENENSEGNINNPSANNKIAEDDEGWQDVTKPRQKKNNAKKQIIKDTKIEHHNRTAVLTDQTFRHIFQGDFNNKGFLRGGGHTKLAKKNMENACQRLRDISSKIDNDKFQKTIKNLPDFEKDITVDSSGVGFLRTKGLAANKNNTVKTFFPDDFERSNLEEVIQSALDDSAWSGKKDLQDANDKEIMIREVFYSYNNKKIKVRVFFTVQKDSNNCYLRVNTCFPIYEGVSS